MTIYVKSSNNMWHWCKNCSEYPTNIVDKTTNKPNYNLCFECAAKKRTNDCRV